MYYEPIAPYDPLKKTSFLIMCTRPENLRKLRPKSKNVYVRFSFLYTACPGCGNGQMLMYGLYVPERKASGRAAAAAAAAR